MGLGAGGMPDRPGHQQADVSSAQPLRLEAEITEADDRRFRGDHESRADSAATILRWLIGDDDQVPVRGENLGELVGGFGDVVRSATQIASILALARDRQQRAGPPAVISTRTRPTGGPPSRTSTTSTAWQQRSPGSSATGPKPPSLTPARAS